jgi:hypothetical protein
MYVSWGVRSDPKTTAMPVMPSRPIIPTSIFVTGADVSDDGSKAAVDKVNGVDRFAWRSKLHFEWKISARQIRLQ